MFIILYYFTIRKELKLKIEAKNPVRGLRKGRLEYTQRNMVNRKQRYPLEGQQS